MKVLIIAAHMDDEVLGCGGTICRHVEQGDEVHVCFVANRAYNHIYDKDLIGEEKKATKSAQKILGYHSSSFLDLNDEQLDAKQIDLIVPIERVVQFWNPEIVYTHHRGDANQDHRAVFQASVIACRVISSQRIRRLLCYEVPSSTDQVAPFPEFAFYPNYYVNIGDSIEKKIRAMEAYVKEIREFPHPRSSEGLDVYAKKRGMEIGMRAAEAFMLVRESWG